MDASGWDERYGAADELVWTQGPNVFIEQIVGLLSPGRALDVAAGEGRHAVWLAKRGWQVTAVDFSRVGLERARAWAAAEGVGERLTTVVADLSDYTPAPDDFDLALFAYLQVPAAARRTAVTRAADSVVVGGRIVVVAHDSTNLEHGFGGPPTAAVLYSPDDVLEDLESAAGQWVADRAEVAERTVQDAPRPALDAVVVARRVH